MAKLILPSIFHRAIDGFQLAEVREKAGYTQQQLGIELGRVLGRSKPITRQYIQLIERHGIWEIRTDMANALEKILISNQKTKKSK